MYWKYLWNAGDFSLHITDTLIHWVLNFQQLLPQKDQSDWYNLFPHVHIWRINQNVCALVPDLYLHGTQVFPKPSHIQRFSPLLKGSALLSFAWEHIPAHHYTATSLNMFVIDLICWLNLFSFIYTFIVDFITYKVSQGPILLDFWPGRDVEKMSGYHIVAS